MKRQEFGKLCVCSFNVLEHDPALAKTHRYIPATTRRNGEFNALICRHPKRLWFIAGRCPCHHAHIYIYIYLFIYLTGRERTACRLPCMQDQPYIRIIHLRLTGISSGPDMNNNIIPLLRKS